MIQKPTTLIEKFVVLLDTAEEMAIAELLDEPKQGNRRRAKKHDMMHQTEFSADPRGLAMYPWPRHREETPDRCNSYVLRLRKCDPPRGTTKRSRAS